MRDASAARRPPSPWSGHQSHEHQALRVFDIKELRVVEGRAGSSDRSPKLHDVDD
jgi:hypothetical protein